MLGKSLAVIVCMAILFADAAPVAAAVVKVPAGTSVMLKTLTETTEENGVGDIVSLSVIQDVAINGKVVIKAGATAQAELTTVQKHGLFGTPTKLVMAARRVNSVDGSAITVGNTKTIEGTSRMICSIIGALLCLFPALIPGGTAKLPAGAMMDAVTTAPAEVQVPD